jgi:preprotein translocase subunit Sss1
MNILKSINPINRSENKGTFENIQNSLDFIINESFKNILLNYNVVKPLKTYYKNNGIEFNLNYFFGFSEKYYEDFMYNYKIYLGRMPEELYPIGSADGGNLVCINKETDEIYFWFHEEDDWGMEGIKKHPNKIARNINECLKYFIMAEKPTKEEIDRAKREGGRISITLIGLELLNNDRMKRGLKPLSMGEALENKNK